ncbi:hypothetical protein HY489_03160 [Candidatus Woesearchaeota archaeon]|nr:hypothetical protein [Candidatus Woesearchaeota archaeon]
MIENSRWFLWLLNSSPSKTTGDRSLRSLNTSGMSDQWFLSVLGTPRVNTRYATLR